MEFSAERFAHIYAMIGPAGIALVFVALFAIYIAVWQLVYLNGVWKSFKRDYLAFEKNAAERLRTYDPKRANPLIRIICEIVLTHSEHSDDIRAEVSYLFHVTFKRVSNGLCWLKLISVVSPLLGLLGTVWGMVDVFQSLADVTHANAQVLASGIWSALITTIMGLSIAIPVLLCYYYLMLKFRGFHIEAIEHSYRALEVCGKRRIARPAASAAGPIPGIDE